jgi:hypothetical protein
LAVVSSGLLSPILDGGPHVALRQRPALAPLGTIIAERLPKTLRLWLFEFNEVPQSMGFASTQ